MRSRPRLICLAIGLAAALRIAAAPLGEDLPASLDALVANYWQPTLTAAFGSFTWAYTDLPSPFSRWLEDQLGQALSKSGRLRLFNRSAAARMDPALKAVYGDFFEKSGVDSLLAGRFSIEGKLVAVQLELTGLSDGILIGTTQLRVPLSSLPPGLDVEPRRTVKELVASLVDLIPEKTHVAEGSTAVAAPSTALLVTASTDRGRGAVYREGENLVVLATVNQPAFIRVFHIAVDGRVQRIWPNRFGGGEGRVAAGEIVRIPGSGDPFSFRMEAPYGTEFIKVLASTRAFVGDDRDFVDLGGASSGAITRGLPTQNSATPTLYAEALASYVITPAE